MAVFVIILVCANDEWESTCGGGLGIIFWTKYQICQRRCQTQLLLESVIHFCVSNVYCLCCTWTDCELATVDL